MLQIYYRIIISLIKLNLLIINLKYSLNRVRIKGIFRRMLLKIIRLDFRI